MRESKEGFTLIELMGVIVVMSIILLVGLPTISNMMKKDVESTYERYLVELYAASESYFVENKDFYPTLVAPGGRAYVTIDELMSEGYIRNVVTDPETNEDLPIETQVEVTVNADYTYSFQIKKGSNQSILVMLDANGGSVTPTSLARTYKAKYGEIPTPTRNGYIFLGWFTEKTGGVQVNAEQRITIAKSHTLYAHWQAKTPTVSFDSNGGSSVTQTMKVTVGKPYGTLPTTTRKGYTFLGWFTTKTAGTLISSNTNVTIENNHTLYAHWQQNKYVITFNANGGNVSPTTKEVTQYSTYGTLPTPTRTGYTFKGWYTAASGGTQVTSGTEVTITANQTLYAQWTVNTYTVTFNANGGGTPSSTSKSVTYGGTYGTLPTISRTGYTFNGWYTATSGGTKIETSTKVTITANQTLYAQWTKNNYTLTFNANGGSVSPTSRSVAYGSTYGTLPTPTRTNYKFLGWYTAASGGSQVSSQTVMGAGNVTIYAHWQLNTVNVTFNANGGSGTTTKAYTVNSTLGTLPSASRSGYTFKGWYTSNGGGSQVSSSTKVTGAVTYYARWWRNEVCSTSGANNLGYKIRLCVTQNGQKSVSVNADMYAGNYTAAGTGNYRFYISGGSDTGWVSHSYTFAYSGFNRWYDWRTQTLSYNTAGQSVSIYGGIQSNNPSYFGNNMSHTMSYQTGK